MIGTVSHNRVDESLEAKARWFASLTDQEGADYATWLYEMALEAESDIVRNKPIEPVSGRIQVLTLP